MVFNFGHYSNYYIVGFPSGETDIVRIQMRHGSYTPLVTKQQMSIHLGKPVAWVQPCSHIAYLTDQRLKKHAKDDTDQNFQKSPWSKKYWD